MLMNRICVSPAFRRVLHSHQNGLLIARTSSPARQYARRAPGSRRPGRSAEEESAESEGKGQVLSAEQLEGVGQLQTIEQLEGLEQLDISTQVQALQQLEGTGQVGGIDTLLRLGELALSDPEEADKRLKELQGLSGKDLLTKLSKMRTFTSPTFEHAGKDEEMTFPDLMTPDPIMDTHESVRFPVDKDNPYPTSAVIRNENSLLQAEQERLALETENHQLLESMDARQDNPDLRTSEEDSPLTYLPLAKNELRKLYRFPLIHRRVTQQTGKGKIHRIYNLVVVGNGDGLVGLGEGKDDDAIRAGEKAFAEAVRRMDYVERFEKRTLWTEMSTKLGSTRVILRPRPVGFGLACNPNVHQVLKAAGIKDASAKVWGSRNPINVIKATLRLIQSGNAPLSMGDGIGGKGKKLEKGSGARSMESVERERGRRLVDLRTW